MRSSRVDISRFWRPIGLGGAELAYTSYGRHAFPRHFHEEYVIAIMVRGVERLRHDGNTDLVSAGHLILLNPGQVHENGAVDDGGFAYRTLYVPPSQMQTTLINSELREQLMPGFGRAVAFDPDAFDLLRRLHEAVEAGDTLVHQQSLLTIALAKIYRHHAGLSSPSKWAPPPRNKISAIQEYLDAHFAETVSLEHLARIAGVSPFHLVHSFTEVVGMPPGQYQLQRRVLHALKCLRDGVPISSAAQEAGFADQSHLHRHIKRFLGVTPGQFRADRKSVQDGSASASQ
jgi:AraC-like DNA-binding protein